MQQTRSSVIYLAMMPGLAVVRLSLGARRWQRANSIVPLAAEGCGELTVM